MSVFKKCNYCKKDLELTSFKVWKNGNYLSNCITCNKRKLLSKHKESKLCNECLIEKPYSQFTKTKIYSQNCLDCVLKLKADSAKKRKEKYYLQKEEYTKFKSKNLENMLCSSCNQQKSLELFRKRKNQEYYKQCIDCNKKTAKNKLKNRKEKENNILSTEEQDKKKCFECFIEKDLSEFKKSKTGYRKRCTKCLAEKLIRNNKRKEYHSEFGDTRKCSKCFVIKTLECFTVTKKGIQKQCEECCIYYKKCQQKSKKDSLVSENILKDYEKQCTRCFIIKNKSEFKTDKHKYCLLCNNTHNDYLNKNRCKHGCLNKSACVKCLGGSICVHKRKKCECKDCDFNGYLYSNISSRVRSALKNGSKNKKTIEYLCCDINTLKTHIEEKFIEGMNWENYGKIWHIDHIIPIKYKNPTLDEVIERLHYLNTQPLWASENISKGNRYIG